MQLTTLPEHHSQLAPHPRYALAIPEDRQATKARFYRICTGQFHRNTLLDLWSEIAVTIHVGGPQRSSWLSGTTGLAELDGPHFPEGTLEIHAPLFRSSSSQIFPDDRLR